MVYLELIAGFALLAAGGDFLVRGAVAVARRIGVSELMIGLTLVGFGTSTPELVASVEAALVGSPGIALGNVVGSTVANSWLILGVGALIAPIRMGRAAFARDGSVLLGAALLMAATCQLAEIGRGIGAGFLLLLLGYTIWIYRTEQRARDAPLPAEAGLIGPAEGGLGKGVLFTLAGLVGVLAGATLLVDAAIAIARLWGLSEAVIGVTLVAIGTALPELATMLASAGHRRADVGFGNVIGSNLFNLLGITGTAALVRPLAVPAEVAQLHVWIMLGSTGVLVWFALTGWRISRPEGAALVLAYAAYIVVSLAGPMA
jgi:cation:H+ antiporter